jgi:thiol-disulfide isomerase/thioredoxin
MVLLRKILLLAISALLATNVALASVELQDTQHNVISAASMHGKWIVLNYWASWCGACAEETPEFNHLYESKPADVLVYGVDFDQHSMDETNAIARQMGIKYPNLATDPRLLWSVSSVSVLPTTFIINPEGKVVEKIIGAHTAESLLGLLAAAKKG